MSAPKRTETLRHPNYKLTAVDVKRIRAAWKECPYPGIRKELAKIYGVSHRTIEAVCTNLTHRDY